VRLIGADLDVAHVNQSHLTMAAQKYRRLRALQNARARSEGRQAFPPPSTATINREITTPLRSIVRFAARAHWRLPIEIEAVKPEAGEIPSLPRRIARDDTVEALLQAIDQALAALTPVGRRQLNYRRQLASLKARKALLVLVHERGYRISEWLRWRWETIDLQAGRAKILLSKPTRWAEFDLSPAAVSVLAEMPARTEGPVFPWRHRSQVYQAIDRIAPPGASWRPHESRRAVVTAVTRNTGNVNAAQLYVSHASINTTLRYVVVDQKETAATVRTGGKPLRSGKPGS
jgi:integrase